MIGSARLVPAVIAVGLAASAGAQSPSPAASDCAASGALEYVCGFVTTRMMDPTAQNGFAAITAGEISGHVYESVVAVDPATLDARRVTGVDASAALQGASTALPVGDEIWIGTFRGDRVGYLPRP